MPHLAVVTLHQNSLLPEDDIVNTWPLITPASADTDAEFLDIANAVALFYKQAPAGGLEAVGSYLSPSIDPTLGMDVALYDLDGHLDG
jgi:hypothetical protein